MRGEIAYFKYTFEIPSRLRNALISFGLDTQSVAMRDATFRNEPTGETGPMLVQLSREIRPADAAWLRERGFDVLRYVPNRTLIVRGDTGAAAGLGLDPRVRWVGAYRPDLKIRPEVLRADYTGPSRRGDDRPVDDARAAQRSLDLRRPVLRHRQRAELRPVDDDLESRDHRNGTDRRGVGHAVRQRRLLLPLRRRRLRRATGRHLSPSRMPPSPPSSDPSPFDFPPALGAAA